MKAYLGSQEVKDKYVSRMKAHIDADELIREVGYNKEGRGCAIGCTLNDYDHRKFEDEIGPQWLAHLVDSLFECVTEGTQQRFALDVLESINPGCDLDLIKGPFLIFALEITLDTFDNHRFPDAVKCIKNVIELYKNGECDLEKFQLAVNESSDIQAEVSFSDNCSVVHSLSSSIESAQAYSDCSCEVMWASQFSAISCVASELITQPDLHEACDSFAKKLLELIKNCKEI